MPTKFDAAAIAAHVEAIRVVAEFSRNYGDSANDAICDSYEKSAEIITELLSAIAQISQALHDWAAAEDGSVEEAARMLALARIIKHARHVLPLED